MKYKVVLRFYKGSSHFIAEKPSKRNKQPKKPNNWFSGKVLRKEIFERTKSVKYSVDNLCDCSTDPVGRGAILYVRGTSRHWRSEDSRQKTKRLPTSSDTALTLESEQTSVLVFIAQAPNLDPEKGMISKDWIYFIQLQGIFVYNTQPCKTLSVETITTKWCGQLTIVSM